MKITKQNKGHNQPFLPRKLEVCNDVESNPGPRSPKKITSNRRTLKPLKNTPSDDSDEINVKVVAKEPPRVQKLGTFPIVEI